MKHNWRTLATAAAALAVVATPTSAGVSTAGTAGAGNRAASTCAESDPEVPPPPLAPPTVKTVEEAYHCIFDNYYSGPVLDSRTLLVPAFAAITEELQRRGLDRPDATLPALNGRKATDWAAFKAVYQKITKALPDDDARAAVATAAIEAMVESLDDNHARWVHKSVRNLYGVSLSMLVGPGDIDPAATEPAYVDRVIVDGPAGTAGIRLGDEILAINDVPLFTNGMLNEGALAYLTTGGPGSTAKFTVRRPATGTTVTATATATQYQNAPRAVESRLVDGNIAYVSLPGFARDLVDDVFAAIADLRERTDLRGVVLDLRGNGGGSPQAVAKLAGALAHGKITSYWCDVRDKCKPNRTDDSVELLNLPFVALTDRHCASACDSFSSAVKDLDLGTLVGTRTAGAVSGPGDAFVLGNGTGLMLPKYHEIGANKEIVDTIGVAPDHYAPTTAAELSAGRDPGLAKAVSLL